MRSPCIGERLPLSARDASAQIKSMRNSSCTMNGCRTSFPKWASVVVVATLYTVKFPCALLRGSLTVTCARAPWAEISQQRNTRVSCLPRAQGSVRASRRQCPAHARDLESDAAEPQSWERYLMECARLRRVRPAGVASDQIGLDCGELGHDAGPKFKINQIKI